MSRKTAKEAAPQPDALAFEASSIPQPAPVVFGVAGLSFSVEDYARSQLAKDGMLDLYSCSAQPLSPTSIPASTTYEDESAENHVASSPNDNREAYNASTSPEHEASTTMSVKPTSAIEEIATRLESGTGRLPSRVPGGRHFQDVEQSPSGSTKIELLQKNFFRTTVTLVTTPDTSSGKPQRISTVLKLDASDLVSLEDISDKVTEELEMSTARYIFLDISGNELGEYGMRAMESVLTPLTHLASLSIARNVTVEAYISGITDGQPSGRDFFVALREWMVPPTTTCLTDLDLSGNWMRPEGAIALAPVLAAHSLLTSLNLSTNNMFSAGAAALVSPLSLQCTHLTSLFLGCNWLADAGLQALTPALVANSSLTCLSLPQNGLSAAAAHTFGPLFEEHFPRLQDLDLVDNLMDAAANKILFSPVQVATTITTLRGLDLGSIGIFFEYVLQKRLKPDLAPEKITIMDLSHASLSDFPAVLLTLTSIASLDLSYNDLATMPYIELCGIHSLVELACVGNGRLTCPPLEVQEDGARACMEYLRQSLNDGAFNISVLLIPIGDTESGKSCVLKALAAADNASSHEYTATVSPELGMWTPAGQENKLNMKVVDLSGRPVYAITHEFFFSRAAVYLFVWRALESDRFESEGGRLALEDMVARWISALQHTVPQATIFVVATHIDSVDPEEVKSQCKIVQEAVQAVLARIPKQGEDSGMHLINQGQSFLTSPVRGVGIVALREQIIIVAKNLPQYGLPLSESFRAFNDALDVERHRNRSVWMDWRTFRTTAKLCALERDDEFSQVVSLMHDLHFVRYAANVEYALAASDEELSADLLVNTVYLDVEWCASVFKGLIRHERTGLLNYFGGRLPGLITDDRTVDVMAKRFYVHGILHSSLMKYLWPFQAGSKDFWKVVMEGGLGKREAEVIPTTVASSQDDYVAIQEVLSNFGVMGAINADEFVVPFIRIGVKDGSIDARTLDLSDCPFRCMRIYTSAPEHFLRRLATRMMQNHEHSELSTTVSVHFTKGNKLHLSYAYTTVRDSILTIRASSRSMFEDAVHHVERMESWYPGLILRDVDTMEEEDVEYLTMLQPVHVFLSHSSVCAEDARGMATVLQGSSARLTAMLSEEFRGKKGSVPECRVAVALLDQAYSNSKRCLSEFAKLVEQGTHIVPVLMPNFVFDKDENGNIKYARWWPEQLQGMAAYDLFLDFRLRGEMEQLHGTEEELAELQAQGAPRNAIEMNKERLRNIQLDLSNKYKKILETELAEVIATVLERWRCRHSLPISSTAADPEHQTIPCLRCVSLWLPEIHHFERSAVAASWIEWKEKEKVRRAGEGKSFSEPFVTCPNGHGHRSSSLLADGAGFEALVCPSCTDAGEPCPFTFPYKVCTEPFRVKPLAGVAEESSKTQRLPCPVCSARFGEPTSVPLVDIVSPEVFISFQWGDFGSLTQELELKAVARRIAQAITWHAGVTCWLDCQGPPEVELEGSEAPSSAAGGEPEAEENAAVKEHWLQTLAAIRQCRTFVVLLSDAYCVSRRTRREFDRAVQTRRFIVPVLVPAAMTTTPGPPEADAEGAKAEGGEGVESAVREASTGWLGGASELWWHHAVRLSRASAGGGKGMAATWTVLKSFAPVSMLGYDEDGSDKDVAYRVLARLNTGEQVQHDLRRLYRTWHGSRAILLAEILRFADPEAEKTLTREEQLQARATKLFEEVDENGNGIIDAGELRHALSNLGIHVNSAQLGVMMAEADIDGDHGIDLQEFLDVVLGTEMAGAQP